jgi:hypothetical protein
MKTTGLKMAKSKVFTIETDKAVDYYSATPELLAELEARRDRAKRDYEQLVVTCSDMRTVLGLDNTEFLTYVGAEEDEKLKQYNRLFYKMCENSAGFIERYSSNPQAGEAELADRMLIEGQDEEC